jgi:Protein of unknown function (DUF2891)
MRLLFVLLFTTCMLSAQNTIDANAAKRFADLALACVHKEYPNKISHNLSSDADVAPPRQLTPAFYGCYDWHSSVHGHWLLARLVRLYPEASYAPAARAALKQSLTSANLQAEAKYLMGEGRASFERPYGLSWLLQLAAEMREWSATDADAKQMSAALEPLENAARTRLATWLPKLSHPVRIGEHAQTAFSLGLMIDYARGKEDKDFEALTVQRAKDFYLNDKNCPMNYEPSGEDFLSPCLAEADAMRRVLPPRDFAQWLTNFLPMIPPGAPSSPAQRERVGTREWIQPEVVTDPTDPKLAHLDGLNLSRAFMLRGIASGLPSNDPRLPTIRATADTHAAAGLAHTTGEHYEGGHWLGSFATYLVTNRGIRE